MLKSEQSVEGNHNIQAGRDINQYGISYADAKEIALDIYRNELPYLTKLASDKAWERVEPVLNEILAQIHQKKPEAINEFAEPEVQYMLGSAMKTASSTEDSVVHDTLVQLAVDHVLSEGRSYERIVDQQAIEVLQKMNRDILKSLQELAFWNTKCEFVNQSNILDFLYKYHYPAAYLHYLESIGCVKYNIQSNLNYPETRIGYTHEILASKIYDLYGIYFHHGVSKMAEEASSFLGAEFSEKFFNDLLTNFQYAKENWITYLFNAFLPKVRLCREDIIYHWVTEVFINKAFLSVENIKVKLLIPKRVVFNTQILDYSLTPLGDRIRNYLPWLLVSFE